MNPPHPDSEAALELETIALFEQLGYTPVNCYNEWNSGTSTLGRQTRSEVVLTSKLRPALEKLNRHLPEQAITLAIEELTRDRSALTLANANLEIYDCLKDRVKVTYRNDDGEDITENVTVIDWQTPTNNDFFLASQFWIAGEMYTRRTEKYVIPESNQLIDLSQIDFDALKAKFDKGYKHTEAEKVTAPTPT